MLLSFDCFCLFSLLFRSIRSPLSIVLRLLFAHFRLYHTHVHVHTQILSTLPLRTTFLRTVDFMLEIMSQQAQNNNAYAINQFFFNYIICTLTHTLKHTHRLQLRTNKANGVCVCCVCTVLCAGKTNAVKTAV